MSRPISQLTPIFGRYAPDRLEKRVKRLVASSVYKEMDYVAEGAKPDPGTGVLYSWSAMPVAFHDIPTLNNMIFSRALWEGLRNNPYVAATLEGKSHWGENCHKICDEMKFGDIACRVTDFWIADDNMVLGNVDLMNTSLGRDIYACACTGRVALSSRGFGDLKEIGNGLKQVVDEEYLHVGFDMVTFPACPKAVMTASRDNMVENSIDAMMSDLRGLVSASLDKAHSKYTRGFTAGNVLNSRLIAEALASHSLHAT